MREAGGPPTAAPPRALTPEPEPGPPARLVLRAARPGRSVALADPETGVPILVGTVLEAGQAVSLARRLPQFDLLPTILGAAVLARSDAVVLRAGADRFSVLAAGGAALAIGAWHADAATAEAAAMGRVLGLPVMAAAQLVERLRAQQAAIGATAPLARASARRDAAETLLALGLPQEAQAMAALALAEDPRAGAAEPRLILALGAAALLAGRTTEAGRWLDDPRLPTTDETVLWRGMLATARGDARGAAPALAATMPLALAYPEGLRARLAPRVADALVEGGERDAAARLIAGLPEAPAVALPRARLAEAEGRIEDALAGYDAVAHGRDRLARARAIRHGIELRLATGRLDAAGAAAALDAALYAWRGDEEELRERLRLAELKRQAGDRRGAFALLRETETLLPAHAAALRPAIADAFLDAIEHEAPLAAVALFDAHPDLLPAGPRGEQAVALLAERLAVLDLGDRAARMLRDAAERAADPVTRARHGARLAAIRLEGGDAAGALAALEAGEASGLPAPLAADRAILRARALARAGDLRRATEALGTLGAAGAAPLAALLVEAQDWAGAATVLAAHLDATLPAAPAPLGEEHRRGLTRLAAFAALGGDEPLLAALRAAHGGRMRNGPLAELFAVLTTDPLRGLADLPRLQRDLNLIRALPSRLEALRTGGVVTR